ncbi:YceI family protein [Arcobacter sp. LA11]|uniref:YceI family protein n=1 Tax=Arcobacter sp. LA11 TaxID=1898176 RepID=UPI000933A5BB|nr:YceI family protein [Arcobacter sp. LA11]
MKKTLFAIVLSLGLISSINAYELNGELGVKWTGYKTEKKAPVSGTFNDIKLDIKSSDDLSTFLKSSMVTIKSSSLESKNPGRNLNITSTLFSLATAKIIEGSISEVNEMKKSLTLNVTMNKVIKSVPMAYEMTDGKIIAKGVIDILDFDMKSSFMAFAKKCGALHQNKSFSDVAIEFIVPYK